MQIGHIAREAVKKIPLFYWVNARRRSRALKNELAALARDYGARATSAGISYDETAAITAFKERHRAYSSEFVPRESGALRVFWVGTNQNQDESGFLQSLRRIAKVTTFRNAEGGYGTAAVAGHGSPQDCAERARQENARALVHQIKQAIADDRVDLLFGQMWAQRLPVEVLREVHGLGIPVINLSMDDRLPLHWGSEDRVRMGSVGLSTGLDMVLTTSPETCLWYAVEGCPALYWPLASDPAFFETSASVERDIDVLFIGNRYGVRGGIVTSLQRQGIRVDCYGRGWPNGYANADEMAALSARARIILGVGTVGHCSDVYTLKLRDFDGPMSGALYLTHRNPDLCQLFREGEEIECYADATEAAAKIRVYLDNPAKRERIAKCGQLKAQSAHSWQLRLTSTFEALGLLQSSGSEHLPPTFQ